MATAKIHPLTGKKVQLIRQDEEFREGILVDACLEGASCYVVIDKGGIDEKGRKNIRRYNLGDAKGTNVALLQID